MTIPELMQTAIDSYSNKDYFNAHYYASLVLEISKTTDGNLTFAKQLASDAWNKLTEINVDNQAVSLVEVAEHFENPEESFKHIKSLLKKDGILAVQTQIFYPEEDFEKTSKKFLTK